jgi:hypothetical protein
VYLGRESYGKNGLKGCEGAVYENIKRGYYCFSYAESVGEGK